MKPKLSDIVKLLKQKANTSDTLFVSDPNDKNLKSYQDSLSLYNNYRKAIPKGSFNYRKYKPEKGVPISGNRINGLESYSGMADPFEKDPIKPVGKYDFYRNNEAAYINGVYFPPQGEALSSGFLYKKPVRNVKFKKSEPKKEVKKAEPVKKEQPKPIEKKKNVYDGIPVYSPGAGSGMPSALVGFRNKSGDTTYIKPEDYERFAVPKYGKAFIESKSKKK